MTSIKNLYGTVSQVPFLNFKGTESDLHSLYQAKIDCESRIPGFQLAEKSNNQNNIWKIQVVNSKTKELKFEDSTGFFLKGDTCRLTPDVWCDVVTRIIAHKLQCYGWFLIDGSIIKINGKVILLAGWPRSGKTVAALYAGLQGYHVLSTSQCIIDDQMNLIAGNRIWRIQKHFITKYFQFLDDGTEQIGLRDYVKVEAEKLKPVKMIDAYKERIKIDCIFHINLQDVSGSLREITKIKNKMIISSQVISRQACGSVVISPWNMILNRRFDNQELAMRQATIRSMANLSHYSIYCRPQDLISIIRGNENAQ